MSQNKESREDSKEEATSKGIRACESDQRRDTFQLKTRARECVSEMNQRGCLLPERSRARELGSHARSLSSHTRVWRRLAVKEVALELKPLLSNQKLLVSLAAGIKLKDLQEWTGHSRLIRVMPNTPSAVGQAATVMSLGEMATEKDGEFISRLFGAIGKIWTANEKCFDAVTGLSGSGPAYIYLAIDALADGGVAAGLPRDLALGLASQTVLGAATLAMKTGKHPGQLKDDVASPGGTTIAGIHELEKGGFRATLMNAVIAATKRSQELSNS